MFEDFWLLACYGSLAVPGIIFIVLQVIFGTIFEWLGDVFGGVLDGLDNFLEGFGIDIIPDVSGMPQEHARRGLLGSFALFLAGFGVAGFLGTLYGGFWGSLILASIVGLIVGGAYFGLSVLLYKQEQTTTLSQEDYVGKTATVTVGAAAGERGEAMVDVLGSRTRHSIAEVKNATLKSGDRVRIVKMEGGILKVKKL